MFPARSNEPEYARLPQSEAPNVNRYGKHIDLGGEHPGLTGQTLAINGDRSIGENPNRYKQHGFYFNADNCISCHACESACSEKNNLPPHLAFRSVGYVEGGSWPAYQRLNISMACNHCDNPVCLKGCPTRAYTKFAEYGAVLQDPNICFGCGYCTWVCPYNAPQLDPVHGQVEKCNMCVDRLEVGLKPACAAACLAGALDFGVIETTPENRHQLKADIPGFPDTAITQPNIRFQQTKSLPREFTRPDAMPLRYVRNGHGDRYQPEVRTTNKMRQWGLDRLSTRENPIVFFTLASQAVVGAFLLMFLGPMFGLTELSVAAHPVAYPALLFAMLGLQTAGLVVSTLHLGKPHRFYRAFNNLRYSPVSREVASIAVFYNLLGLYTLAVAFPKLVGLLPAPIGIAITQGAGWGAVLSGPLALWFMHAIYRIPARPFWNHWQVLTTFFGSMLTLGALGAGFVYATLLFAQDRSFGELVQVVSWLAIVGLVIEGVGLWFHARDLKRKGGEGAASHYEQTTTFGKTYYVRNSLLALNVALLIMVTIALPVGVGGIVTFSLVALSVLVTAAVGRMLFYALVIPTTMPGAFFWRNRGFQQHAQESGLAARPQTGIVLDAH